jgi:hypothetical protein
MYTPSFSICAGQLGTRPGWWIWSWWMPQWKRCWRRRTRSQMADWLELGYQRTLWAYNGLNSVCVFFFKSIYDICIDLIWDSFIWLLDQDSSDMCIYIYVQIYIYTWYIFTIYIYAPYMYIYCPQRFCAAGLVGSAPEGLGRGCRGGELSFLWITGPVMGIQPPNTDNIPSGYWT